MENKAYYSDESLKIIIIRMLIAAAWADGHLHDAERKVIAEVIGRARISDAKKSLMLETMETPTSEEEREALLSEICNRATSDEQRMAIFQLVEKVLSADSELELGEIDFRDRLHETLRESGSRFFKVLKDVMHFQA